MLYVSKRKNTFGTLNMNYNTNGNCKDQIWFGLQNRIGIRPNKLKK